MADFWTEYFKAGEEENKRLLSNPRYPTYNLGESIEKMNQEGFNAYEQGKEPMFPGAPQGFWMPTTIGDAFKNAIKSSPNPEEAEVRLKSAYLLSQTYNIPLPTAIENFDSITQGLYQRALAPKTAWEAIKTTWQAATLGTQIAYKANQLWNKGKDWDFYNDPLWNEIQHLQALMPAQDEIKRSLPVEAAKNLVQFVPSMLEGVKAGALGNLAGAAAGALIGSMLVPGMAVPLVGLTALGGLSSLVAQASLTSLGGQLGSMLQSGQRSKELELGSEFYQMLTYTDPVSGGHYNPKVAWQWAGIYGALAGAVESMEIGTFFQQFPNLGDTITAALSKKAAKVMADPAEQTARAAIVERHFLSWIGDASKKAWAAGGDILSEMVEETTQEALSVLAEETAKKITEEDNGIHLTQATRKEIVDRLVNTAIGTFLGMSAMKVLPGSVKLFVNTQNEGAKTKQELKTAIPTAPTVQPIELTTQTYEAFAKEASKPAPPGITFGRTEQVPGERYTYKLGDSNRKRLESATVDISPSSNESTPGTVTILGFEKKNDPLAMRVLTNKIAAQFPGWDIEIEGKTPQEQALKRWMIENNPRGTDAGINPFSIPRDIPEQASLKAVEDAIRSNKPTWTNEEVTASTYWLTKIAPRFGMTPDDLAANVFHPKVIEPIQPQSPEKTFGMVRRTGFEDGLRSIIGLGPRANPSTIMHEMVHTTLWFALENRDIPQIGQFLDEAESAFGIKNGDWQAPWSGWTEEYEKTAGKNANRSGEEALAYALEDYLAFGKAPNKKAENILAKLGQMVIDLYNGLKKARVNLSPEINQFFDKILEESPVAKEIGMETVEEATGLKPSQIENIRLQKPSETKVEENIAEAQKEPITAAQAQPERIVNPALKDLDIFQGEVELQKTENIRMLQEAQTLDEIGVDQKDILEHTGWQKIRGNWLHNPLYQGVVAYHGSPYEFNEFDLSHIGTGEGEQAFGAGHYFTTNRNIAEWYAKKLADNGLSEYSIDGRHIIVDPFWKYGVNYYAKDGKPLSEMEGLTIYLLRHFGNDKKEVADLVQKQINHEAHVEVLSDLDTSKLYELHNYLLEHDIGLVKKRNLYKVELNPNKNDLWLEYDNPLKEQPQDVQNAIKNLNLGIDNDKLMDMRGQEIYQALMDSTGKNGKEAKLAASQKLSDVGITGIRYPAGTLSGGARNGEYNYVVFKDKDIKIIEHALFQGVQEKENNKQLAPEFESAKRIFGITTNPNEAGYILPNGEMLDFTGRNEAGGYQFINGRWVANGRDYLANERITDHRGIDWEGSENDPLVKQMGRRDAFIEKGAIRVDMRYGLLDMAKAPTAEQLKTIKNFLDVTNGAEIELKDGERHIFFRTEDAPVSKIIGYIRRFYNGEDLTDTVLYQGQKEENSWINKVQDVLSNEIKDSMPGREILEALQSAGIKNEEMEKIGLYNFLDTEEKRSPKEVNEFIQTNGFKINETPKEIEIEQKRQLYQEEVEEPKPIQDEARKMFDEGQTFDDFVSFLESGLVDNDFGIPDLPPEQKMAWYKQQWDSAITPETEPNLADWQKSLIDNDYAKLRMFLQAIYDEVLQKENVTTLPGDDPEEILLKQQESEKAYEMHQEIAEPIIAGAIAVGANTKPLSRHFLASVYGIIRANPEAYARIYGEITGDEKIAALGKQAEATRFKEIEDQRVTTTLGITERARLAEQIKDEKISQAIRSGNFTADEEVQGYVKKIENELKSSKKKIDELNKDIAQAETGIDYQTKTIAKLRAELQNTDKEIEKIQKRIAQYLDNNAAIPPQLESQRRSIINARERLQKQLVEANDWLEINRQIEEQQNKFDNADRRIAEAYARKEEPRQQWVTARSEARKQLRILKAKQSEAASFKNSAQVQTYLAKLEEKNNLQEHYREMMAAQRAVRTMREYRNKLTRQIMRPAAANANVRYKSAISTIQQLARIQSSGHILDKGYIENSIKQLKQKLSSDPAIAQLIPSDVLNDIIGTRLSKLTLNQLESLHSVIQTLRETGREVQKGLVEQRQIQAERLKSQIGETLVNLKGYKQEEGINTTQKTEERIVNMLREIDYAFKSAYRQLRDMDGGVDGTNVEFAWNEMNRHYRNKMQWIKNRQSAILDAIKASGAKPNDWFDEIITIPGAGKEGGDAILRKSDLMGMALAFRNEDSRQAMIYGNLFSEREKSQWRDIAKVNKELAYQLAEDAGEKKFYLINQAIHNTLSPADWNILDSVFEKDASETAERLIPVVADMTNTEMKTVDHYFPLIRRGVGNEKLAEQVAGEIMDRTPGLRRPPENGFTKERIKISPWNQKSVETDLLTTWLKSIERQEQYIHFAQYGRELDAVYLDNLVQEQIRNKFGDAGVKYITQYIAEVKNPSEIDRGNMGETAIRFLRGNLGASYLAFRTSSVLKQVVTSPWPALPYAGPKLFTEAVKMMANPVKYLKDTEGLSVILQNRSFDIIYDVVKNANTNSKIGKLTKEAEVIGMKGLEYADRFSVAIGWRAVYEKALEENGGDQQKAIEKADQMVMTTQPMQRGVDLAPAYRAKQPSMQIVLQFTQALNVVYQQLRYDLPAAIKAHDLKTAVGIAVANAIAGALLQAMISRPPKDPEKKAAWWAFNAISQATDSIPLIGEMVTRVTKRAITGEKTEKYTDEALPGIAQFMDGMYSLAGQDVEKALTQFAEGIGTIIGLPVSAVKEAGRALSGDYGALIGRPRNEE
jgi:hypothetical protein